MTNPKNFQFLEEEHKYLLDGERLPSVTEIIKSSGDGTDYSDIPEWILERASEIGHNVHKTVEDFYKEGTELFSSDSSAQAYIEGYKQFVDAEYYEHMYSEMKMYCDCHLFAGTVDLVGLVHGKPAILDIKTTNSKNIASWNLQTAAYKHLAENQLETELEMRYVIHLEKSGTFSLIPCTQSGAWDNFLRYLEKWKEEND